MSKSNTTINYFSRQFSSTVYFLGSGFCLGIGFIIPPLWVTVFPGLILYLIGLKRASTIWQAALGGFIAWTGKSMFAIGWFWSTYPIIWIELGQLKTQATLIGFYWLTTSIFLGLAGIFCAACMWLMVRNFKPVWLLIAGPLIWLGSEILGSFSFSFFTLGEGMETNAVFSFGYLGYLLAEHEWLLQIARLGGVYLLTMVTVTIGIAIWYWFDINNYDKRTQRRGLVLLLVIVLTGHFSFNPPAQSVVKINETKVAIIDTRFGGAEYFSLDNKEEYRVNQLIKALAAARKQNPDYIVMPEDSRYLSSELSPSGAYARFRFQQSDPAAIIVEAGPFSLIEGGQALRATIYDGVNKTVYAADKQYLVPQGEFMPIFYIKTLNILGYEKAVRDISSKLQYRPGPYSSQAELPKIIPGILFCFASADPYGVRKLVKERELPFIAHPISHAWFNEPVSLWHQFDTMLKIHALWNQVPIVSAGNMVGGALFTVAGEKNVSETVAEGERWSVSLVSW